jgi:hypothetical protein
MVEFGWNMWTACVNKTFRKTCVSPLDGVHVVVIISIIKKTDTSEHTQCRIQREFMFGICTALYYTTDIAIACACLMNSWRLALCSSFTVSLKKKEHLPATRNCDPQSTLSPCEGTAWRRRGFTPHPNTLAVRNRQRHSTRSVQISAFPLSSYLSSWIKQGTSSDVSSTSANFVVQPRLLRRFCWRAVLKADRHR